MNKEKQQFLYGFATGATAISLIGFLVVSFMFVIKSNFDFNISKNEVSIKNEIVKSSNKKIETKNGIIKIVEYSDFQCPYCSRFHNTLNEIKDIYGDKVSVEFKHFPLDSIHKNARSAAEASECAREQGRFWEFADELFANQRLIKHEYYPVIALKIGLDKDRFIKCFEEGRYREDVEADQTEGRKLGVKGTPGSIIDGELIKGAKPLEDLKEIINKKLDK